MPDPNKDGSSNASRIHPDAEEDFGYDFFPDRKGRRQKSIMERVTKDRPYGKDICEKNIYKCLELDMRVKVLVNAMKSFGCPLDPARHLSCEDCFATVTGGFDPSTNQVVVCQNNSRMKSVTCSVLAHELTHMFDYCRANVDFANLDHLACTEIRAANFNHCHFMTAIADGIASPMNLKNTQKECVRQRAIKSVVCARDVTQEAAENSVDKVFDKCYNDLEPLGRIPRRRCYGAQRMYAESFLYGYSSES